MATNALPEEVCTLFSKTIPTGIKHGTVTVLWDSVPIEVTTYRVEGEYLDHRRPSYVNFVTSLKEDLSRRDFTINAMAMDRNGQLIDYFNGRQDLKDGVVRTVGNPEDRLKEDPLRMLRAVRFANQLDFRLDLDLIRAINKLREETRYLSDERVIQEMEKMWQSKSVSDGIRLLFDTKLIYSLPPFRNWGTPKQVSDYLIDKVDQIPDRIVRWAFFLYLWKDDQTELMDQINQCKFSNKDKGLIQFVLKWGTQWPLENSERDWKVKLLTWGLDQWIRAFKLASCFNENVYPTEKELKKWWHEMPIKHKKDLVINGKDLLDFAQLPAGPWVGKAINYLTIKVALRELPNEKEILLKEGCCFATP